jgi:hypothetical protein
MNINDYLNEELEAFSCTDLTEADIDRIFEEIMEKQEQEEHEDDQ